MEMAEPSLSATPASGAPASRIKEFFLARQPILTRDGHLYAYELLFRNTAHGPANVTDDLTATATVIAHAAELGLENVIGASHAFINVNAELLFSDVVQILPRATVVLEILETVEVDDALVARVEHLAGQGYRFALDDVAADSARVQRLLPLVDIVKVDLVQVAMPAMRQLARRVKEAGKQLLAEKVETPEQFQSCKEFGFDYFQGYYFAKPFVLAGRKLPPGQAAVVKLMGQLHADVAPQELEETIKQEPALGLALLRLLNAKAQSVARPVESLGQILEVLDRTQLQHWLQILAYADPDAAEPASSPLLMLATARGKLLELLAQALPQPGAVPQVAFTVGVMSLLDALFDLPMEKVLDGLTVAEDVRAALLAREGTYGDMLRLAEVLEQVDGGEVDLVRLLRPLGLTPEQLGALQLQALEWSGTLAYLNQPGKAREQA